MYVAESRQLESVKWLATASGDEPVGRERRNGGLIGAGTTAQYAFTCVLIYTPKISCILALFHLRGSLFKGAFRSIVKGVHGSAPIHTAIFAYYLPRNVLLYL